MATQVTITVSDTGGISTAVDFIVSIVAGVTSASWTRHARRLSTLDDATSGNGLDYKYSVTMGDHERMPAVSSGSHKTLDCNVIVEFARFFGGGDAQDRDHHGLHKALQDEAINVTEAIINPNNWAFDSTGIILINENDGTLKTADFDKRLMIWESDLQVLVRFSRT